MLEAYTIAIEVYANQDDFISVYKDTIKHVFRLNFAYELLVMFTK